MSSRTPNFRLNTSFTWGYGHDNRTLERFSYIRPIEYKYVPEHVIENKMWSNYDKEKHVFAYTKYGFVMLLKSQVEEIG